MIDLENICVILENKQCSKHNQNPSANVEDGSIKIEACCDNFKDELEGQVVIEIQNQVSKSITDMFKF